MDLGLIAIQRCSLSVPRHVRIGDAPTYSTTEGSAGYLVVLKFEVLVEDGCIELDFAVEAVANALPVRSGF